MRPLLIIPAFSDSKDAVGQVARRFVDSLDETFDPIIISRDLDYNHPVQRVEYVGENKLYYYVDRVLRRLNLEDFMMQPDYLNLAWNPRAVKRVMKIADNDYFSYIHSISNPSSSHLAALDIKRKTGLPWIAQFYDPWRDNQGRVFNLGILDKRDAQLEEKIARNADIIIHSNDKIVELWRDRYGEEVLKKIHILPFVVEKESHTLTRNYSDKLIISHIGNFLKERESSTFIEAIRILNDKIESLESILKIQYVGRVTQSELSLIQSYGLSKLFNIVGYVSEKDCNTYFESSDIFLAVDTKHEKNVFFPSKILKYFSYGRPILGIVTEDSVLERELRTSGNFVFKYNDSEGISEFIERALYDRSILDTYDIDYAEKFYPESVMYKYKKIINYMLCSEE